MGECFDNERVKYQLLICINSTSTYMLINFSFSNDRKVNMNKLGELLTLTGFYEVFEKMFNK